MYCYIETSKTGKEGRRTLGGMCFRYKQSGQESLAQKMLLSKDVILEAGSEPWGILGDRHPR